MKINNNFLKNLDIELYNNLGNDLSNDLYNDLDKENENK